MRTRDDVAAPKMTEPATQSGDAALVERVAELELQLAAAQRMLAATMEGLEGAPVRTSRDETLPEIAARLQALLGARMKELEHKGSALEAANAELRSLTQ